MSRGTANRIATAIHDPGCPLQGQWPRSLVRRALCLLSAAMVVGVACAEPEPRLTVHTWWVADGETDALAELLGQAKASHPEVKIDRRGHQTARESRGHCLKALQAWEPPSTCQANSGAALLLYVLADGCGPAFSMLEPISELEDTPGEFTANVRKPIADSLTYRLPNQVAEQGPYGVPLNIHRLNLLYYDSDRVAALKLPTSSPFQDLSSLKSACSGGLTLALLTSSIDALPSFFFENVLPAVAAENNDSGFYQSFWDGCVDVDTTDSASSIAQFAQAAIDLWPCIKWENQPGWAPELSRLLDAGYVVSIGDWATPTLSAAQYRYTPFPSTGHTFVYTSDTFFLSRRARYRQEIRDFLGVAFSREAQIAFNREKGSIPARADINLTDFPPDSSDTHFVAPDGQQRTGVAEAFRFFDPVTASTAGNVVLATSGQIPAEDMEWLANQLKGALDSGNVINLRTVLHDFYPRIKHWAWVTGRIYRSQCSEEVKDDVAAVGSALCLGEGAP